MPDDSSTLLHNVAPSFVAGSVAGAVGQIVGFPLDTIKVHVQTGRVPDVWNLYRGCRVPVVMSGTLQAFNLGLYETCRKHLSRETTESTPLLVVSFSAGLSGLCMSPVTTPLVHLKIRQQIYDGDMARTLVSMHHRRIMFRGFGATVCIECARSIYMGLYVGLKRCMSSGSSVPLKVRMTAAFVANTACCMLVCPLDVVRTLQLTDPRCAKLTFAQTAARVIENDGVLRLFKGLSFTVVRAGPVACVVLPLFDICLLALNG